jgi:hypothetical protein
MSLLLYRDIGRLAASQNFINYFCRPPPKVRDIRPIGHEASRLNRAPDSGNCWHLRAERQRINASQLRGN